jgi:hypothetical protein
MININKKKKNLSLQDRDSFMATKLTHLLKAFVAQAYHRRAKFFVEDTLIADE